MNDRKLKQLFDAARGEPVLVVPEKFDTQVLRAVRASDRPLEPSVFESLNALFPRLATAAVLVIALCLAGDLVLSALDLPRLDDGLAELSSQTFWNGNEL